MIELKLREVIRKLRNNGSISYFDSDTMTLSMDDQDKIICRLKKSIRKVKGEVKIVSSIEECSDLKLEEFKFAILENEAEVKRLTKSSKYLLFYNEKINDAKLNDIWANFCAKENSISVCKHRILLPYKKKKNKEKPPKKTDLEIEKNEKISTTISWIVFAVLTLLFFGSSFMLIPENFKGLFFGIIVVLVLLNYLNIGFDITFVKIREKIKNLILEKLQSK